MGVVALGGVVGVMFTVGGEDVMFIEGVVVIMLPSSKLTESNDCKGQEVKKSSTYPYSNTVSHWYR